MGHRWVHCSLIYRQNNRQDDSFIQSYVRPFRQSMIGPFVDRLADSLTNHGFGSILLYYIFIIIMRYKVLHYTLIYYKIIQYVIYRCIVLRCMVLYGPTLAASFVGSFDGSFNGRFSKWAGDRLILSFIYWLGASQVDAFGDWPIR